MGEKIVRSDNTITVMDSNQEVGETALNSAASLASTAAIIKCHHFLQSYGNISSRQEVKPSEPSQFPSPDLTTFTFNSHVIDNELID